MSFPLTKKTAETLMEKQPKTFGFYFLKIF